MKIVDLTYPISGLTGKKKTATLEKKVIRQDDGQSYVAMIYNFRHDSMVGTYLDFPGHIKDTDDGTDAANYPIEKLYRVEATVIRLNRESGSGGVTAEELRAAAPAPIKGGGLVINALGKKGFDAIDFRSVYLTADAVQWIAGQGVHLFVSDIYESKGLHGVFGDFFRRRVLTVCRPVNLDKLTTPRVRLTALCAPYTGVTQLPCRLVAELIEE